MNGSEPRVIDLDALEALNPDPVMIRVGGRELEMRELPHGEMVAIMGSAQSAQDAARAASAAGDNNALSDAGDAAIDMLMRLFGPFNPWLTPEWLTGLTDSKIVALLQHGILTQHGFVGSLGVPDVPPVRAVRKTARRTGKKSTARSR